MDSPGGPSKPRQVPLEERQREKSITEVEEGCKDRIGGRRQGDQRHGSPAEAHRWPPETRKVKEIESLLESSEGTSPANTVTYARLLPCRVSQYRFKPLGNL